MSVVFWVVALPTLGRRYQRFGEIYLHPQGLRSCQYLCPKRCYLRTNLNGITTQKNDIIILEWIFWAVCCGERGASRSNAFWVTLSEHGTRSSSCRQEVVTAKCIILKGQPTFRFHTEIDLLSWVKYWEKLRVKCSPNFNIEGRGTCQTPVNDSVRLSFPIC
jgi:hypothetical protein